jgi:hypothetical protein
MKDTEDLIFRVKWVKRALRIVDEKGAIHDRPSVVELFNACRHHLGDTKPKKKR